MWPLLIIGIAIIIIILANKFLSEGFMDTREKAQRFSKWVNNGGASYVDFRKKTGGDVIDYYNTKEATQMNGAGESFITEETLYKTLSETN